MFDGHLCIVQLLAHPVRRVLKLMLCRFYGIFHLRSCLFHLYLSTLSHRIFYLLRRRLFVSGELQQVIILSRISLELTLSMHSSALSLMSSTKFSALSSSRSAFRSALSASSSALRLASVPDRSNGRDSSHWNILPTNVLCRVFRLLDALVNLASSLLTRHFDCARCSVLLYTNGYFDRVSSQLCHKTGTRSL